MFCKDVKAYREFVREKRGIDKSAKLRELYSIDGGGDHFKFCANLIEDTIKPGAPKNPKHMKGRFLQTSVRTTYMLSVCEKIPETPENVKIVLDHLNLGEIKLEDCVASDFKLINMLIGIQGHSSSCPCPYCEWKKKDQFIRDKDARDRTFGLIRY